MKKNYVIGCFPDEGNRMSCYTYHSEVQYGDEDNASFFLEYVQSQSPDKNWQIFWIDTERDKRTREDVLKELAEWEQQFKALPYEEQLKIKNAT